MTAAVVEHTGALPPEVQISGMLLSQVVPRLIHLMATLNLADHLAAGPQTADALAPITGTHAPTLHRVMRSLASVGLLTEDGSHRFALQPLGAVLRSGTPSHAAALIIGGELCTRSMEDLLYSAQSGRTAFEHVFGAPLFNWLGAHPEQALLFNHTMVGFHGAEPPAVAAAYDFSAFDTIADIGGSTGNLLATILSQHAGPRGILYDLPHVVAEAPAVLTQRGVADRVRVEGGSFFDGVPTGADAYVMSHIIHDWNADQCQTILGHCRRAMPSSGRLLLVEMVLPEGDVPHPGKLLDILMLTVPGGEERTPSQYSALLDRAGFQMTRVVPTASPVSIVEAIPR